MLNKYQEELCRSALDSTGKRRFSTTTLSFCPGYGEYVSNMYKVNFTARTCVQDLAQWGVTPTDWPKVFYFACSLSSTLCALLYHGKASKGHVQSTSL